MPIQTDEREIRSFELDAIQIRSGEGEGGNTLEGHAAVFGKKSEDMGGFREIIDEGFFSDVLNDDVRALINHDAHYILARTKNKTLELKEDKVGLLSIIKLSDTSYERDLKIKVDRGDINQMSFAFRIDYKKGERWEVDGKDVTVDEAFSAILDSKKKHDIVRHLVKAKRLYDVSPVTYPAYPQTDVSSRALEFKNRQNIPGNQGRPPEASADGSLELYKRKIELAKY
jgi:hypothetical protein